jgi:hypothetical protein
VLRGLIGQLARALEPAPAPRPVIARAPQPHAAPVREVQEAQELATAQATETPAPQTAERGLKLRRAAA